jgi:hypothetical protein
MNIFETHAQPANSGVLQKVQAELLIPDPEKSIAMDLLHESTKSDTGADGNHRQGCQ